MSAIIEKPRIVRAENSHKGTFGTALIISGSYGMAGAAMLCTNACLKSGVGIAKLCIPSSIYDIVAKGISEAVFVPCGIKPFKRFSLGAINKIKPHIKTANSIVIGCGMSQGFFNKRLLKYVIKNADCPIIIDADGINMLSRSIDILRRARAEIVLTPHPKEFSRLSGKGVAEIEADREKAACDFAREYGVYVVLKGHETVVSSPAGEVFINQTGNSGMATGGSGDTLSGILAARVAQNKELLQAVKESVYIHGMCGDMAAQKLSKTSMLPSDMIEQLPFVFKNLEE
ncbi:MAG: NAD(P)H-hydrate dehydratase [Clostridiales bacterium]|nr:NAD(P)H-hydrate dehydratase [Candidatus Equinaster intestinalis]